MDVQEDHTFSSYVHPVTTTNIKSGQEMDVQEDHTFSSYVYPVTTTNIKSGQRDGRPRGSRGTAYVPETDCGFCFEARTRLA